MAEYRDASKEEKKKRKKKEKESGKSKKVEETGDSDFVVLTTEELMPGEVGAEKDNVENWKQFFTAVTKLGLWLRYCMAIHRRVGWKVSIYALFIIYI